MTLNVADRATSRILGFDVARALAIWGMVLVNYRVAMEADYLGPDWLVELSRRSDGRFAAIFVILAGVGISLLSRRAWLSHDPAAKRAKRLQLVKRALFLFVLGMANTIIWPLDILHFYGLYMLVGALMLFASDRWLWLTSLALVVAYVVFYAASGYPADMTYRLFEYQASWIPVGFVRHLLFEGYYPAIPWLAFLLVGMWIGRLDVRQTAVRRRLLIGGLSIGVLAELASLMLIAVFSANATPDQALVVERAFSRFADLAMPLYILAAGGTAVAVIALCLTLTERHPEARWVRLLAWTGQLALTLYVAHEVIGLGPLVVLGLDNGRSLLFSIGYGTAFFVAAVIFATLWRRRFMRGPLEWVMRRLTA